MKDILTTQVSIMLQDSLPNATDYEEIARRIYEESGIAPAKVAIPVPDKEIWRQLPLELPKIIGQSDILDFQISAVNTFLTFKRNQKDKMGEVIQIISNIFSDIGKNFNIAYRLGIVLTVGTDSTTLIENTGSILDAKIGQKAEWQLSFLNDTIATSIALNVWKKYICNKTEGPNIHVIDVNVKPTVNLDLRNKSIQDVFEIVKNQVDKTYDEFEE